MTHQSPVSRATETGAPEYLPAKRGFDHYLGIPYRNDMTPASCCVMRLLKSWRQTHIGDSGKIIGRKRSERWCH